MRLIDADSVDYENIMCSQNQLHWLAEIIEQQPTIDAVPVVRCKDSHLISKVGREYKCHLSHNYSDYFKKAPSYCRNFKERKENTDD